MLGGTAVFDCGLISDMRMMHVYHYNNALVLYLEAFDNPSALSSAAAERVKSFKEFKE